MHSLPRRLQVTQHIYVNHVLLHKAWLVPFEEI